MQPETVWSVIFSRKFGENTSYGSLGNALGNGTVHALHVTGYFSTSNKGEY